MRQVYGERQGFNEGRSYCKKIRLFWVIIRHMGMVRAVRGGAIVKVKVIVKGRATVRRIITAIL